MTEYVVFQFGDGTLIPEEGDPHPRVGWREIAKIPARSATSAIKDALAGDTQAQGSFVAVPARSWRPVSVKVETKTALRFS